MIVQGDTTTTFAGALAAFYHRIPVAHVEAGLRTDNIYSPWPEEVNRRLVTHIADLHFAPTARARENLLREGIGSRTDRRHRQYRDRCAAVGFPLCWTTGRSCAPGLDPCCRTHFAGAAADPDDGSPPRKL